MNICLKSRRLPTPTKAKVNFTAMHEITSAARLGPGIRLNREFVWGHGWIPSAVASASSLIFLATLFWRKSSLTILLSAGVALVWIVFEAVRDQDTRIESAIYVVAVDGGQWVRITDGKHWDDKPRWSPDGRVIYFLSERSGLFNVWGVHFDLGKGSPVGEPVPVTALDNPNLMVPKSIEQVGLALTQDRLVVTVTQASGSIWVLENVDRY